MASITKELNLYRSYRRATHTKKQINIFHSYFTLPVILFITAVVAWSFMLRENTELIVQIEEINSWLNNPAIVAEYNEKIAKEALNNKLLLNITEVDELTLALSTYPEVSSELLDTISSVGGEQVSMVITGYNSTQGELFFEAHSPEVIDIPAYVLKLQQTELFHKVEYTGYVYEDFEYVLRLRCTLRSDAGRKEA